MTTRLMRSELRKPLTAPADEERSKPESEPKPKRRRPRQKTASNWFTIRDIIDEKKESGDILYLIDWDGTDPNDRPYDPTWEPAANVTSFAINAWRDKRNEEASRAVEAPVHNDHSPPPESAQETDPVQAPDCGREKREPKGRHSDSAQEESHKHEQTDSSPTASNPRALHSGLRDQLLPSSGCLGTRNSEADELARAGPGKKTQGAQIVIELPGVLNPLEFQVIPISNQSSPQATFQEHMRAGGVAARDQRVIPDSQEISGTSASETHNSYPEAVDSQVVVAETQFSGDPPAPLEPLDNSPRASLSSGIPSHQPDSRSVRNFSFFANPNTSTNTNSVVNPGTYQDRSLLKITSIGPSQGPSNESRATFQTQPEVTATASDPSSSVTTSNHATSPAPFSQYPNSQGLQGLESQFSDITNRGSTPSNYQPAQIVDPLSSQPGEATSQSQSSFSVFGAASRRSEEQIRDSSQALSESDNSIRISGAAKEHKSALPTTSPGDSPSAIQKSGNPSSRSAAADLSRNIELAMSSEMNGTPAVEAPLSARERMRLLRDGHFNRSSVGGSASPAASSPAPLNSTPHVPHNSTPQAETHVDSEKGSTANVSTSVLTSILTSASGAMQTQAGQSFESAPVPIVPSPQDADMLPVPLSLDSYHAPQIEQPATLDPSALTLSIEDGVEGSPSVQTDDGFTTGPLPRSTNSDDDEMQTDLPRSLLPQVPTGPCEYLITLPFQTSSRPQYNDIIRENESLMNEYNLSFRVFPYRTPRKDLVEKLDMMFSRLFDMCDYPPFLDSLASMTPEQITKHVIGTNAKFSFVAELLDNLQALNSDKEVLILVRPGKLMDLLSHVIQSTGCHYIRSGQEIISAADAKHALTVSLSSTSDEISSAPVGVDVVIAFDHTFRQELVPSTEQSTPPIVLALVNIASIQHLNMQIMENLQPLERKNVLMLALVKAMRYVEEPDHSESLFSIADKFARRIQTPEDDEDDFYWEPQSVPTDIFDDLYAASSQIEATLSGQSLSSSQHPDSRKRSYVDDDSGESLPKRPKMSQPQVVTSLSRFSSALRDFFGDDLTQGSDNTTVIVSADKLQALSEKFAELEAKLEDSKIRETEFRQLSDRAQKEVDGYAASINTIQRRYMDALKERGIFEADCLTAQGQASVLSKSLESCHTEIATLKQARTKMEKELAEANDALLHSSNPDLVKAAELSKDLHTANADVQDLKKRIVVMQSDLDYTKNLYDRASQRATELSLENRAHENKLQELQRKADENVVEVNKVQSRNEVRILAQQVKEQKTLVRERTAELNRVKEELKSLKSGRRETRQSSVPRSPRLSSLGVMSPRNGTRGPSAMGGPSSSRGTSPQPPMAVFDGPVGSGNGVQNAALFNQGPAANRFAHLRDQRF